MRSEELRIALNRFNPKHVLEGEELDTYYVRRPNSPLSGLETYLRTSDEPIKVLFSGHRGCGKSTELRKLARNLGKEYCVAEISVSRQLDIADFMHTDIVLVAAVALLSQIIPRGEDNKKHHELLEKTLKFLTSEIITEEIVSVPKSPNLTTKLNAWVVSIESKFSREKTTRDTVRTKLLPRISLLLDSINEVCEYLKNELGTIPLIIIEDIDKADLETAHNLFFNHAATLNRMNCHIIYTFPISLCYANEFTERIGDYNERFLLPNITLANRDGSPNSVGIETMRSVIRHRSSEHLFEPAALDLMIEMSGGLLRYLIRIAQSSILSALASGVNLVTVAMVREEVAKISDDYKRLLTEDQYSELFKVRGSNERYNSTITQQLLANLSVLEYKNGETWVDVQPIVKKILDEREA